MIWFSIRLPLGLVILLSLLISYQHTPWGMAFFSGALAVLAGLSIHLVYVRPIGCDTCPAQFWLRMWLGLPLKWGLVALLWSLALGAHPACAMAVWAGGVCALFLYLFTVSSALHKLFLSRFPN